MISIVPLAGPDFVHPTRGIKPLISVDGEPLLLRAITSRPWWRSGALQPEGLIFVLRDVPETSQVSDRIDEWFPGAQKVVLSSLTGGALMSALAGISLVKDFTAPLCVDLVDIFYESEELITDRFERDKVGAIVPYFYSQESCYSYFEINQEGLVIRAVEKQVISHHASAGTYFFRDAATYLKAVAFSLENITELSVNGVLFVCPAINYLVSIGNQVVPIKVGEVKSVSKMFH
ncbi:MAG: hypothetical protein QNJ68_18925 [Microcoleaceae cyanobacterium MO_207.B10]|nr:hypothetical protein [Microcoleaceae cyanobacterium MO_207.B10]